MRFRIADLQVELSCHTDTLAVAEPYATEAQGAADMVITPAEYDTLPIQPPAGADPATADYVSSGAVFGRKLIPHGGLVLHACAVVHKERAYLFAAPSGTGKSTHVGLWCQQFPDCYVLNDDKPAIRVTADGIYAYGTPWAGKQRQNRNAKVPLGGICFLQRGETDRICRVDAAEALVALYAQTAHMALTQTEMDALLTTIEKLLRMVPAYRLQCTPTPHAAEVAYRGMVEEG